MTSLTLLGAPYDYVQTEEVVSEVKQLLRLDLSPTGTGPTSVIIARGSNGKDSLLKLRGLGKHLWRGIDAQDYINKLREGWE